MSKKRRAEPPILASVEEEFARVRKRVTPLYPYDSKTTAIRLPPSIDDELRVLVFSGNKVVAVKRVTALTGTGLRVSKDYVEGLTKERQSASSLSTNTAVAAWKSRSTACESLWTASSGRKVKNIGIEVIAYPRPMC